MKPQSKDQLKYLRLVKAYCDKSPENILRLALGCNYSSSEAIAKWIERKVLPNKAIPALQQFFLSLKKEG